MRCLQPRLVGGEPGRAATSKMPRPETRTASPAERAADGVVGDQTWSVSLHAASATLESAVGLNFIID